MISLIRVARNFQICPMPIQATHEIHELVFEDFTDIRIRAGLVLLPIIQKLVFGRKLASEAFVLADQIHRSIRSTVTVNFIQATEGCFLSQGQRFAMTVRRRCTMAKQTTENTTASEKQRDPAEGQELSEKDIDLQLSKQQPASEKSTQPTAQ
ncbi:MAG: hypothetical protein H7222_16490 [Methylotenera sp.]|nr:hypothetical protein [Oligoflexia bacterium]